MLDVGCWTLDVVFLLLLFAPFCLRAQLSPQIPPNLASQLMVPQPAVDHSPPENISATAEFDPPVVRPGENTFYRVAINATENTIEWPEKFPAPPELLFGAGVRGQLTQPDGTPFHPLSGFVYEITATAAGHFVVPNFVVSAGGRSVEVPSAGLDVETNAVTMPARKLSLEVSATNLFFGQPFRVRVILPAAQGNRIEALRDVQFNGNGILTDRLATRQSVEPVNRGGQLAPAYIYETVATPLATGPQKISAQGFTAGSGFGGPVVISAPAIISGGPPNYVLLASDAVSFNVRPLPAEGELPGFTGAIGKFFSDPPHLSTNRLRVGEPVRLKAVFHGEGDLTRLVPPAAPRSRDWQIIADEPAGGGFTLIPETDEPRETPAIPFSYFNPATTSYVDLTIPPLPVTVIGEGLPTQLPAANDEAQPGAPAKLSDLAPAPGKTASSLRPLQLRGWFVCVQLAPVAGFLGLWRWDRRRKFLEAHPEIVRRRKAKRRFAPRTPPAAKSRGRRRFGEFSAARGRRAARRLRPALSGASARAGLRRRAGANWKRTRRGNSAPDFRGGGRAICRRAANPRRFAGAEFRNGVAGEIGGRIVSSADSLFLPALLMLFVGGTFRARGDE